MCGCLGRAAAGGTHGGDHGHDLTALGAAQDGGRWCSRDRLFGGCAIPDRLGEAVAHGLQGGALARAEEAVVAHLAEAFGQDVLQEAADEVERVQGTGVTLAGARVGVDEGDLVVFECACFRG